MKIYIGQDKIVEITKEKFQAYEAVRESGATNMFDVKTVKLLSRRYIQGGLERQEIIAIMNNYIKLNGKFTDSAFLRKVIKEQLNKK